MEINTIIMLFIGVVSFAMSVFLLMGKGSFLIAGYNTSTAEEKNKYNEKVLCRIVGAGLFIITIIIFANIYYSDNLPEAVNRYGILGVTFVVLVLSNTVARKKQ